MNKDVLKVISLLNMLVIILTTSGCKKESKVEPDPGTLKLNYVIGTYYSVNDIDIRRSKAALVWTIKFKKGVEYTLQSAPNVFLKYANQHGERGDKVIYLPRPAYTIPIGIMGINVLDALGHDRSKDFELSFMSIEEGIKSRQYGNGVRVQKPVSETSAGDLEWIEDETIMIRYVGKDPLPKGLKLVLKLEGGKEIVKPLT